MSEIDEETRRRHEKLAEIARRSTAEEDRERFYGNMAALQKRKPQERSLGLYAALAVALAVGGFLLWRAVEPPVDTATFTASCLTSEGYDTVCRGKRASLRGELGGDVRQRVLLIGETELNVELDEADLDAISGQDVEIAGRFERGGMSDREEVRPAKVAQVLTSREAAAQRVAERQARADRDSLRAQCVGRADPQLVAMGGGGRCQGSGFGMSSCLSDLFELDRRCRAAGF